MPSYRTELDTSSLRFLLLEDRPNKSPDDLQHDLTRLVSPIISIVETFRQRRTVSDQELADQIHLNLKLPNRGSESLMDLQRDVAAVVLGVFEDLKKLAKLAKHVNPSENLLLFQTLASIVFEWGLGPCLNRALGAVLNKVKNEAGDNPKELFLALLPWFDGCAGILAWFSGCIAGISLHADTVVVTTLTDMVYDQYLSVFLHCGIALGWNPANDISQEERGRVERVTRNVLSRLCPSKTLPSLMTIISESRLPPRNYIPWTSKLLAGGQLVRSGGVYALLAAVFQEEEYFMGPPDPYELKEACKLIKLVPRHMSAKEYYTAIIPQLISLSANPGTIYGRASFIILDQILPISLHKPFVQLADFDTPPSPFTLMDSLVELCKLTESKAHSLTVISHLLTPIITRVKSLRGSLRANDDNVIERFMALSDLIDIWEKM